MALQKEAINGHTCYGKQSGTIAYRSHLKTICILNGCMKGKAKRRNEADNLLFDAKCSDVRHHNRRSIWKVPKMYCIGRWRAVWNRTPAKQWISYLGIGKNYQSQQRYMETHLKSTLLGIEALNDTIQARMQLWDNSRYWISIQTMLRKLHQ